MTPLLNFADVRVRDLAAESFVGYLLRKCRDDDELESTLTIVLATAAASSAIFEGMRAAGSKLHSGAPRLLRCVIKLCSQKAERFPVLCSAVQKLTEHLRTREEAAEVTEILLDETQRALDSTHTAALESLLFLLRKWYAPVPVLSCQMRFSRLQYLLDPRETSSSPLSCLSLSVGVAIAMVC